MKRKAVVQEMYERAEKLKKEDFDEEKHAELWGQWEQCLKDKQFMDSLYHTRTKYVFYCLLVLLKAILGGQDIPVFCNGKSGQYFKGGGSKKQSFTVWDPEASKFVYNSPSAFELACGSKNKKGLKGITVSEPGAQHKITLYELLNKNENKIPLYGGLPPRGIRLNK